MISDFCSDRLCLLFLISIVVGLGVDGGVGDGEPGAKPFWGRDEIVCSALHMLPGVQEVEGEIGGAHILSTHYSGK